jgi:hypothetical protein
MLPSASKRWDWGLWNFRLLNENSYMLLLLDILVSGYPVVGAPGGIVCSEQEIIATGTLLLHAFFIA